MGGRGDGKSINTELFPQDTRRQKPSTQPTMNLYFRGTMWLMVVLHILPRPACSTSCPSSCMCNANGAVMCVGTGITDAPQMLPLHTYLLQLRGTSMSTINEHSLANKKLLLRFGLTHSHLHTIHPRAFREAPQLKSVKLSSNDLATLPPRVFSPLDTLEQLHLDGNKLEIIAPDMFEGLVGLKDLDLSRNKLAILTSDIFDGLRNLTFLNLGRNFVKRLPPTIFHSLTNLRQLTIYYNELEVLEDGIFDKLVNLAELKIHHNRIASLPPQVFWALGNLKMLTLSSNKLQGVPEKSFYNMPMLNKLTLYNNPLLSLPDELMGHMPNITELYLFGTNLTTVPGNLFSNMSGLVSLKFHLNPQLRELPPDLFCCLSNLRNLSLRDNDLHYLHPQLFSKLTTLELLFLNDNKLTSLPGNLFHGLGGLVSLDLKNNQLKTLPGETFLSTTALKNLTLSGNTWDCTCPLRDIARWIRQNELVVLDRDDVMCHSPVYHLLRPVSSLSDEELNDCDGRGETTYPQMHTDEPTQSTGVFFSMLGQKTLAPSTTTASTTEADTHQPYLLTTPPAKMESPTPPAPTPTESHIISTPGQTTPMLPTTTAALTTTTTTQEMFLKAVLVTHPPTEASTPRASEHTTVADFDEAPRVSPAFREILVIEQGPDFVHHSLHRGWVYVWFLPSSPGRVGFLMFCHVFLVATGLLLILAAMYGMCRLNKTVRELQAECNEG